MRRYGHRNSNLKVGKACGGIQVLTPGREQVVSGKAVNWSQTPPNDIDPDKCKCLFDSFALGNLRSNYYDKHFR